MGRALYGFSTLLCTPASLSQDVGAALGARAGPRRIRDVVTEAGLTRFRIAAQTPFNNIYEIRCDQRCTADVDATAPTLPQ